MIEPVVNNVISIILTVVYLLKGFKYPLAIEFLVGKGGKWDAPSWNDPLCFSLPVLLRPPFFFLPSSFWFVALAGSVALPAFLLLELLVLSEVTLN